MKPPRNYSEMIELGISKKWIKAEPCRYHVPKTPRRAGLAFAYVRWFASRRKQFTYHQLCPPFEPNVAYGYCDKMAKFALGLVKLRNGTKGNNNVTPLYAADQSITKKIR